MVNTLSMEDHPLREVDASPPTAIKKMPYPSRHSSRSREHGNVKARVTDNKLTGQCVPGIAQEVRGDARCLARAADHDVAMEATMV